MKTLIPAAIRCSLMFTAVAVASLYSVQPAQAYTITLEQVGSNVVANGSGAINLTGLSLLSAGTTSRADLWPNFGYISFASGTRGNTDTYQGFSGPSNFGTGSFTEPSSFSGDSVGIDAQFSFGSIIDVPRGYVSGAALLDRATWNNATFASLGVTPGTYVWTWGTGLENQNFTLAIGVPDGGSTVSLLGCALLGLAAVRRKLSC